MVTDVAKPVAPAAPSAITLTSKPMIFNLKGGTKASGKALSAFHLIFCSCLPAPAAAKTIQAPAALGFTDDPEEGEGEDPAIDSSAPIFSKKTASNISKWNQKQGELTHGASHPVSAFPVMALSLFGSLLWISRRTCSYGICCLYPGCCVDGSSAPGTTTPTSTCGGAGYCEARADCQGGDARG